ncbi:hypothetical protein [Sphingopyxis sp. JAI128]|uniref:hypothetical protein n=1 Tax=Sphingopyxis sp. JAI128 TaxID=2723066 RepID=UPI00161FD617|nr:hypothetical protein [Sphingopyxis sp. JAI128]MBB6425128.1 hypothetical protein [Sphingopyxis sp. JAI128]
MTRSGSLLLTLLALAGCDRAPDNGDLAEAEARGSRGAAESGRIDCALEGAKLFDRACTIEELSGEGGVILVVGRGNVGYRRLQITTDGRGVVSADGAEPAKVSIVGDNIIEVAIGNDRYRLPANTGGAK